MDFQKKCALYNSIKINAINKNFIEDNAITISILLVNE